MNFVLVAVVSGTKIVVSLSMNPVGKKLAVFSKETLEPRVFPFARGDR